MHEIEQIVPDIDLDENNPEDILGFYLADIKRFPKLEPEDEKELASRINYDSKARERFYKANLGLVVSIAKKHTEKGVELLDLIQDGNIKLMTAMQKFDPDRGYKFSTYAYFWIKNSIWESIRKNSQIVRIPSFKYDEMSKLQKEISLLTDKLGHEPTNNEISKHINYKRAKLDFLLQISKSAERSDSNIDEIQDFEVPEIIDQLEEKEIKKEIVKFINNIDASRWKDVAELRYGEFTHTYREIGKILGMHHSRAHQIDFALIKVLRNMFNKSKERQTVLQQSTKHNNGSESEKMRSMAYLLAVEKLRSKFEGKKREESLIDEIKGLTDIEKKILKLKYRDGYSNNKMRQELGLTEKLFNLHRDSLFLKMNVFNES